MKAKNIMRVLTGNNTEIKIGIAHWNITSINNKKRELNKIINESKIGILSLNEQKEEYNPPSTHTIY